MELVWLALAISLDGHMMAGRGNKQWGRGHVPHFVTLVSIENRQGHDFPAIRVI